MLRINPSFRIAVFTLLISFSGAVMGRAIAADKQICDISADSALGLEDYPTAIILHRNYLRAHPNDALAHYHLGFAYGMVGLRADEINEYHTAVNLGLQKWDLLLNLGLAYFDRQELAKAGAALEHAVLLGPGRAEAHFNLALVYEKENRLDQALREITTARRLAPEDPDAANTNAIICAERGDLVCARSVWTHIAQAAPDYVPAQTNLAVLNRIAFLNGELERRSDLVFSRNLRANWIAGGKGVQRDQNTSEK